MKRKTRILIVMIVLVGLGVFVLILLSTGRSAALPNPNGYDDFVKAGEMLEMNWDIRRNASDYREMSAEELRAFAFTNAGALAIAMDGLGHECRVPIRFNRDWARDHLGVMASFKKVTWLFLLTARLAELERRTNDAVILYLDSVRFSHESARGGWMVETSVTRTSEAMAMNALKALRDSLDAEQNRRIAKVLERLNARRESWSEIYRREIHYRCRAEFRTMLSLKSWQQDRGYKARFYQAECKRVQGMLDFAARAYELETGSRPTSITNLVPGYLTAIPKDPLTGTNLVYTPRFTLAE